MPELVITTGNATFIDSAAPATPQFAPNSFSVGSSLAATRYGLLRFDLSGLPGGAVVTAATLTLWQSANANFGDVQTFYPLLPAWVAAEATWNEFAAGQPWTGGSVENDVLLEPTAEIDPQTVVLIGGVALNSDVIALVQAATGGVLNLILVRNGDPHDADFVTYYSFGHATKKPKLTVTYAIPANGRPVRAGLNLGLQMGV